jgi:hypothetical protein
MQDPQALRELAKRCRKRAKISVKREIIEQLYLWASELTDAADEIERSALQQREMIRLGKRIR